MMLATVGAIWCCIVGATLNEDQFFEGEGIFLLLDLLEVSCGIVANIDICHFHFAFFRVLCKVHCITSFSYPNVEYCCVQTSQVALHSDTFCDQRNLS